MKKINDIIKRTIITSVGGSFLAYIVFLFTKGDAIVNNNYINSNIVFYIILIILSLYMIIFFGIYPIFIKMTKATLFSLGIAMIIIGEYVIINDAQKMIYLGDIIKVLGVIIVILSPTNLLISKKIIKQKQDSKMQIIEV